MASCARLVGTLIGTGDVAHCQGTELGWRCERHVYGVGLRASVLVGMPCRRHHVLQALATVSRRASMMAIWHVTCSSTCPTWRQQVAAIHLNPRHSTHAHTPSPPPSPHTHTSPIHLCPLRHLWHILDTHPHPRSTRPQASPEFRQASALLTAVEADIVKDGLVGVGAGAALLGVIGAIAYAAMRKR